MARVWWICIYRRISKTYINTILKTIKKDGEEDKVQNPPPTVVIKPKLTSIYKSSLLTNKACRQLSPYK